MYFAGEDERHFHVAHPSGHAVSMAKAALSPEVQAQIRALPKLPKPLKLSEGIDEVPPIVQGNFEPQPGQEVPASTPPPEQPTSRFGSTLDPLGSLEETVGKGVLDPAVQSFTPGAGVDEAMAAQSPAAPTGVPGTQAGPAGAAPAASAPAPAAPAAPAAAAPATKPTGESSPGPILDAAKKEQEAIRSKATAEYDAANKLADLHEQQAKQLLDHDRETQQMVAADRARQDGIFNDIANSKVDPNHFWQEKSTGSKLLAGIGMIFSGMGSGLAGGPNLAHQVIQRAIDRDIDAQKANIGKKQNLLAYYQRQTGDDIAARQMTKATMLNAFAGQVQAMTNRTSAPVIKQAGEIAAQQARIDSFNLSQQAIARSQGIKQGEITLRQAQEAETVRHQLYGDGTGAAKPASAQLLQHAVSVGLVKPEEIVTVDRQGNQMRAKSEASGKVLNEKLPDLHAALDLVDRLQQLRTNPMAVLTPSTRVEDEYSKTIHELAVMSERALAGKVSEEGVNQQVHAIGTKWNQFVQSGGDPLAAIRNTLEGSRQNLLGQHVWGYHAPAQVREQPAATGAPQPPAAGAIHVTNGRQGAWLLPGKPLPAGWKQG